eukprot:13153614-Alexandrium_andersonii.AAC.1
MPSSDALQFNSQAKSPAAEECSEPAWTIPTNSNAETALAEQGSASLRALVVQALGEPLPWVSEGSVVQ